MTMKKPLTFMLAFILLISACFTEVSLSVSAVLEEERTDTSANLSKADVENNDKSVYSYESYIGAFADTAPTKEKAHKIVDSMVSENPVVFTIEAPCNGLYTIGMSYRAFGAETGSLEIGLKIDNKIPFSEAKKLTFARMWQDEVGNRIDGLGNEFAAKQILYDDFYFNLALDVTQWTAEPYRVFLTEGTHEVEIFPVSGSFELQYFEFGIPENLGSYQTPKENAMMYNGAPIIIEAENALLKNSYWLSSKADNSSAKITPNSTEKNLVNYIGGGNWKASGETIIWETPELPEGYYQLGFSFRQNTVLGGKTYRKLVIDGKTPFAEASAIGFSYNDSWQQTFYSDDNHSPYLIYLSAGKHEIALSVVPGDIAPIRNLLKSAVADLSSLYVDITMVTGETVDAYRDYDLFSQISDMDKRLKDIRDILQAADAELKQISGQESGSHSSVIKSMIQVIEQMLNNRYTAHQYKTLYYNKYCSVASVLNEMQNMPLDIDKLVLTSPEQKKPFEKTAVFSQIWFSIKRFFASFFLDYNNISGELSEGEHLTIWVNWGRDQAQVLNSLVQTSFTAKTGISVDIQLVNASIVQAVISGRGPDCFLQHSRSEPVNLAMRGVLYDLTSFDDLDEVLERFQEGAEIPYRYKDGLYALPDTQLFYLMYYRKDIFEQLELSVPETWGDFQEVCKLLTRNNLSAWIPNNVATDTNQVNAGIGSINLFPTMLMQKGLSVYSTDGRKTNLSDSELMVTFGEWTDYYRKLKLPRTLDFYNRFRTGNCPLGISNYTMYTTLKAAAPEIEGLWNVAPIPGTVQEDGTVSHISSGGGTACAILNDTQNPKAAWAFLKWWTDAETQLSYSNEVESILGAAGRVALSNVEAFKRMSWDSDMLEQILSAWDQVEEIPEYPGSYYVSRSIYQSFWNVVNDNQNPKDMLLKYSKEADSEIERKWKQYENR